MKNVIPPQAVTLPSELIEKILLALPIKSLLRFKCVSKPWLSIISDPRFAKSHTPPTEKLLVKFSKKSKAASLDIEAPLNNDSVTSVNIPNPLPSSKRGEKGRRIDVVGSCSGFLLLKSEYFSDDFIYFVIWNPLTGLQKRFNIRFDKRFNDEVLCGIGYDSSTDDVVVPVILPPHSRSGLLGMEINCFSSRTNSWSHTESTGLYGYMAKDHRYGLILNGALHWLVRSYDNNYRKVIAFDMIERRVSEIPLSHDADIKMQTDICHLKVMGGYLCMWFAGLEPGMAQMWVMKEYKVQSSWTRSLFDLSNFSHPILDRYFFPICFTKNGEVLGYDNHQTLVRRNGKMSYIMRTGHKNCSNKFDDLRCCTYTESLLSLPRN